MIKAIFFDLDGTLLPMDEGLFTNYYFKMLCKKAMPYGYDPKALIDTVWAGTKCMMQNDGSMTNEQAFWKKFAEIFGEDKVADKVIFEDFYANEFYYSKNACEDNPLAKDIVAFAKEKFGKVILSTNPIFPKVATAARLSFVDLKEEDFDFITTYENFSYAKPNPAYFQELLKMFSLSPDEVILFGNNESEDGDCALKCGIKTYLVGDHIIKNENKLAEYEYLTMDQVIPTLEKYL